MFKLAIRVFYLYAALSILSCFAAYASVGTVSLLSGTAVIQRADLSFQAETGSLLETKDVLVTAQGARAQVVLNDGTVISVGGNSELQIDEFTETGEPKVSLNLVQGTFKAITGQIARQNPENFRLGTRTATVGIRGTIIYGKVTPEFELFATLRGQIFVIENTTGASVEVPSGQFTRVLAGSAPSPAADLTPEVSNELSVDPLTPPPSGNLLTDTPSASERTLTSTLIPEPDAQVDVQLPMEGLDSFNEFAETATIDDPDSVTDVLGTQISQDNFNETISNASALNWWYSAINADFLAMTFSPPVGTLPDATDNYSKWGLWEGGAWVAGVERINAVTHLNTLTNQIYQYNGMAKGHVYYGFADAPHTILENTQNNTQLTFDFGAGTHTGFIHFQTSNGFNWDVALDNGNVNLNNAVFNFTLNEANQQIQGTLQGNFFGPEMQSLGGFFNITDAINEIQALGVIKAEK